MINTYTIKCYKGYVGDFATEWWTDEDWLAHREHVEQLKKDGTFGEEFEVELSLIYHPIYDSPQQPKSPIESYRLIILDFNK
jgi:hypothetical protein